MSSMSVSKGGCITAGVVGALALGVILLWSVTVKIPADAIGVRTEMSATGVEARDFGPGYVLCVPGFHTVRAWDPTWTNLTQKLDVRGSDQYTTSVDVSIIFRIAPGKCHEVAAKFRDEDHIEQVAKNALNKYANEILAQMSTEDFYNSRKRDEKASEAQAAMARQLEPMGIEIRYLLLRNIIYDPKFETQLLQKQLAGQRKSLEMSKGLLAGAETETQLIKRNAEAKVKQIDESKKQEIENLIADTDRKVSNILQDAKTQVAAMLAKAESQKRQQIAAAELLKSTAVSAGTAAMSKVYARPGASYYFARKALEGIKLGDIELNSNQFNPLDSNTLLRAVGLNLRTLPVPNPGSNP